MDAWYNCVQATPVGGVEATCLSGAVSLSLSGAGGVVLGLECFHAIPPWASCLPVSEFSPKSRLCLLQHCIRGSGSRCVSRSLMRKMICNSDDGFPGACVPARDDPSGDGFRKALLTFLLPLHQSRTRFPMCSTQYQRMICNSEGGLPGAYVPTGDVSIRRWIP